MQWIGKAVGGVLGYAAAGPFRLVGLALGIGGAWVLAGILESMLFNIEARDPVSFILGSILLAIVAVAACWIPARRATRVDPATVLREE